MVHNRIDNNMVIKMEEKIDLDEDYNKLKYIAYQKERYPCFGCKYLISSCVYTTINRRPSIICGKRETTETPDECGFFEAGKYSEHIKPNKPTKKVKAWSE